MTNDTSIWTPSPERVRASQMHAFMTGLAGKHGFSPDWPSLWTWSIQNRTRFWSEMWDATHARTDTPATATCTGQGMLDTRWFPGLTFNFARHLLRFGDDRPALHFENEQGETRTITFAQLNELVAHCALAMRAGGVSVGDRVAAFMPNVPETVIAMLAGASMGATFSSCSPDFGLGGVLDRFGQISPKLLVAADGYRYNGKTIDLRERIVGIVRHIPSIERAVIVPFLSDSPDLSSIPKSIAWPEFLGQGSGQNSPSGGIKFEPLPFDHPLYIMYSSGTTGIPKCIVHGAGGTLLQHTKELMLHCDLRRDDTIFYFTTCGWMMWNWLISSLSVGAGVVLYEGAPFHPDPHHLWQMAERWGVTVFGTSPKFLSACEKNGLDPARQHDLSRLRAVLSTGSPLTAENFRWVYGHVKGDLQLSSICGGTDIISCFMLGNPMLPVHEGQIQCRGLGMDVKSFDSEGRSRTSAKGELVCCSPFPSQPVGFWNDSEGKKYRAAYFERYPGVWHHGDYIEITESGGVIVYGRSDATLNPAGVRIGTAEVYREVEKIDEVLDSIVVGKRTADADVEVCLFVVLRDGVTLDDNLADTIRRQIAAGATKRHVPKYIRAVSAVPYTISGKKVELAVAQMIHGEPVPNRDALANPDSLDQYAGIV